MNSQMLKMMIEAGAVKYVDIVADGAVVHVSVTTNNGNSGPATTLKGKIKTWSTIDSAAKWLRGLGVGRVKLNIDKWTPGQRAML